MKTENWRPIHGYEGTYQVSDHGRVMSIDRVVVDKRGRRMRIRGRVLKGRVNAYGYSRVFLCREGTPSEFSVHALVADTFIGPRPEGADIRHWDGDPANNAVENLIYGSRSENMLDCVRHGRNRQARQTACIYGHDLIGPNLITRRGSGRRQCCACNRASSAVAQGRTQEFKEYADKEYRMIMHDPDRNGMVKRVCKLRHPLESPNLVASEWLKGTRKCLACDRARALIRDRVKRGVKAPALEDEAERQYLRVIATGGRPLAPGPKP